MAVLTETWYQEWESSTARSNLYTYAYLLSILSRSRTRIVANGRQYGGIAIVSRNSTPKLDAFPPINPDDHEVMAAVGRVVGIPGRLFVIACYAPPNLTPPRAKLMTEYVVDVIEEGKRKFPDCHLIITLINGLLRTYCSITLMSEKSCTVQLGGTGA